VQSKSALPVRQRPELKQNVFKEKLRKEQRQSGFKGKPHKELKLNA
jgi:hypothetical protein